MANQGMQTATKVALGNVTLDPRIIFDINEGVLLSFPTAFFDLDYLLTSVTVDDGGFTAGLPVGPDYQVVYSLGYEPSARVRPVTMTQLHPAADLESGSEFATYFFRPKYASSVYFIWSDWTNTGSPPSSLAITFINSENNEVWHIPDYAAGVIPVPELPWPSDAVAVRVQQNTGSPMVFFKCVSVLEF